MIRFDTYSVSSDTEGMLVRRIGSEEAYSMMTHGGDTDDRHYEEIPADAYEAEREEREAGRQKREEYESEVARLVRERYTESEEFALQRKAINAAFLPQMLGGDDGADDGEASEKIDAALAEYAEYNAYVEECKREVRGQSYE